MEWSPFEDLKKAMMTSRPQSMQDWVGTEQRLLKYSWERKREMLVKATQESKRESLKFEGTSLNQKWKKGVKLRIRDLGDGKSTPLV